MGLSVVSAAGRNLRGRWCDMQVAMTSTTPDQRPARSTRGPRARSKPITGVASGSLGTGTAVTDETTLMETPKLAEPAATAQAAGFLHAALHQPAPPERTAASAAATPAPPVAPQAETPARTAEPAPARTAEPAPARTAEPEVMRARRDPFRPIGLVLAGILVALAGVAVLAGGLGPRSETGAAPGVTVAPAATDGAADQSGGEAGDVGPQGGGNANGHGGGNGNGHGNGNGNGHGPDWRDGTDLGPTLGP
jgi:hypothetical protein